MQASAQTCGRSLADSMIQHDPNSGRYSLINLHRVIQLTKNEAFWTPDIASSQFDNYAELGSQSKSCSIKNYIRQTFFRIDEYPELGSQSKNVSPVKNRLKNYWSLIINCKFFVTDPIL